MFLLNDFLMLAHGIIFRVDLCIVLRLYVPVYDIHKA